MEQKRFDVLLSSAVDSLVESLIRKYKISKSEALVKLHASHIYTLEENNRLTIIVDEEKT